MQSRQVLAEMLPIEWVFASHDGNENVGFRELIVALSEGQLDSIFSTELIVTLTEHMWKRYYNAVFNRCFIPFCVYFTVTQYFISNFVQEGINSDGGWFEAYMSYVMIGIIVIVGTYFALLEIVVMIRSGRSYWKDVFNWIDIGSNPLNMFLVGHALMHDYGTKLAGGI